MESGETLSDGVNPAPLEPDTARRRTSILIVDDHQLVGEALAVLLQQESDFEVCGQARDAIGAKALMARWQPQIVLLDLMLEGVIALRLLSWMRHAHPQAGVLITSMHEEALYGNRVLAEGARGFVSKAAPAQSLRVAIRTVRDGGYHFSDSLVRQVLADTGRKGLAPATLAERLTEREMEVFCLLGEGRKTVEIARQLHLSASTIETYRERLKKKLGLGNATQLTYAAVCWMRDGLLPRVADN